MDGVAGESARQRASELRAHAASLEAEARRWERGAEGERRTAELLDALRSKGHVVLHDLSIPGSRANIDHVVVGPNGVAVVDSKAYRGSLRLNGGTLWHGKYPLRRELAALAFEVDSVRTALHLDGFDGEVRTVVCVHGATVPPDPTGALLPAVLCTGNDLHRIVTAPGPTHLGPAEVRRLGNFSLRIARQRDVPKRQRQRSW